jgi:radical SAM protein with 4Fe4S-binding SPASM domain
VFDLIEKYGHPNPYTVEVSKEVSQPRQATQITIYGGEPLMAFEKIQRLVNRSLERGMKLGFSVLSNGTVGTQEQANWLKSFNIWTQRSIDGHPEAQEKYRKDSIEPYKKLNDVWKDYESSRRMTIRPEFAKDLLKSLQFFESMGFHNGMSPMLDYYVDWSDEQIADLKKSIWQLAEYFVKKWKEDKPFYMYYFNQEIIGRFITGRSDFGCGGGRNLYAISQDGWVYMCHRFCCEPHDSPFCLGHIKDVINGTAKGLDDFVMEQVRKHDKGDPQDWNEECKTCVAQYGCEKGCMHNNMKCEGCINKIPKVYCEVRKVAAEAVTWIDLQLHHIDKEWYLKGNILKANNDTVRQMKRNYDRKKNKNIPPRPFGATSLWCQPDMPNNPEASKYYWK